MEKDGIMAAAAAPLVAPASTTVVDSTLASTNDVKRRKLDSASSDRLRCEFFLEKKKRYCAMTRRADSKYCAEHSTAHDNAVGSDRERVPCPKDPNHSVWKKNLSKHLKKCNANQVVEITDPWYKENLNCETMTTEVERISSLQDHKDELVAFINSLNSKYETEITIEELPLEDQYSSEDALKSRFDELSNKKHIVQQASIIEHLKKSGILAPTTTTITPTAKKTLIVEFGCGRAELSRYVNKFLNSKAKFADFLLIDRASPRLKHETKFVKDYTLEYDGYPGKYPTQITRRKIDIKDLALDAELVSNGDSDSDSTSSPYDKVFAISKHLCGVATDLTLRCCLNSKHFETTHQGCAIIAMCCRHCCSYLQLLPESKTYLETKFQIKQYEFDNFLVKLCSWATCGVRADSQEQHYTGLTYAERLKIGHRARRIIDESRRYAMEQRGYSVKLCRYVTSEISLENHLMILTSSKK